MGKNQVHALNILSRLINTGSVTVDTWREACLTEGIIKQRFYDAKKSLTESGMVEINNSFVRLVRNGNAVTPPKGGVTDRYRYCGQSNGMY